MNPVTTNKDVMSGTPCFAGTRVPVKTLFDHLIGGYTVDYVLSDFPSMTKEQAIAALALASKLLEENAVVVVDEPDYEVAAR